MNASKSKFCGKCGKPLSSARTSNPTGRRASPRAADSVFCKRCNRQVRVRGKANYYLEPDSPVELNLIEWECLVLECNHKIPIRRTGRTKNDLTGL